MNKEPTWVPRKTSSHDIMCGECFRNFPTGTATSILALAATQHQGLINVVNTIKSCSRLRQIWTTSLSQYWDLHKWFTSSHSGVRSCHGSAACACGKLTLTQAVVHSYTPPHSHTLPAQSHTLPANPPQVSSVSLSLTPTVNRMTTYFKETSLLHGMWGMY